MLNRRSFMQSLLATVPCLRIPASIAEKPEPPPYSLNGYERMIAMQPDSLDVLGRPRSWSLVRDGFHPISPERVIVLTEKSGDGRGRQESAMQEYLNEHFDVHPRKLELILRLMRVMTDYYHGPHLFRDWAIGLAKREALAPTSIGHGFGLLHQFQNDGFVQLMNSPVDWWLFLFPGGAEWQSWEPVHAMIGHVFAPQSPFLQLPVWQLTVSVGLWMDSDSWSWVGEVDRVTAAQTVNLSILMALQFGCIPEADKT